MRFWGTRFDAEAVLRFVLADRPHTLIGGHLVSTLLGLIVVKMCGPGPWAAALALAY